jgi:hypothetical protein
MLERIVFAIHGFEWSISLVYAPVVGLLPSCIVDEVSLSYDHCSSVYVVAIDKFFHSYDLKATEPSKFEAWCKFVHQKYKNHNIRYLHNNQV